MTQLRKRVFVILYIIFPTLIFSQHTQKTLSLNLEGVIRNVYSVNLNDNSDTDLLVFHHVTGTSQYSNQRYISIFPDFFKTMSQNPTQTIELNRQEILFDILQCQGKPLQLLFLREDGLYSRTFNGDSLNHKMTRFIQTPSLLPSYDRLALPRWPLIMDLEEDGQHEIFIPNINHLEIYKKLSGEDWYLYQRLWYNPSYRFSDNNPLTFSIEIPEIKLADMNGDGIKDIFVIKPRSLDVFLQDISLQASSFLLTPDFQFSFDFETGPLLPGTSLTPDHTSLHLHDLNGDNCVDLILPKSPKANFTHAISQLQIYINQDGQFSIKPDFIFTATNFHGEFAVEDFNNDSIPDIAMLHFDLGLWEAIQFLLTRKIKNCLHFYYMDENENYHLNEDHTLAFKNRLVLNTLTESTLTCMDIHGDFSGDGQNDLIISTAIDKLVISPGRIDGGFSTKNKMEIEIPVSSNYLLLDINSNHKSDIIFWYPYNRDMSLQISWITF